jgi:hypothetical protein
MFRSEPDSATPPLANKAAVIVDWLPTRCEPGWATSPTTNTRSERS